MLINFRPYEKRFKTSMQINLDVAPNSTRESNSHGMVIQEHRNVKVKAFFSTPNFINDLTDLSVKVVK